MFNDNVFMMVKKYIVSFIFYKYFIFLRKKIFVKLRNLRWRVLYLRKFKNYIRKGVFLYFLGISYSKF